MTTINAPYQLVEIFHEIDDQKVVHYALNPFNKESCFIACCTANGHVKYIDVLQQTFQTFELRAQGSRWDNFEEKDIGTKVDIMWKFMDFVTSHTILFLQEFSQQIYYSKILMDGKSSQVFELVKHSTIINCCSHVSSLGYFAIGTDSGDILIYRIDPKFSNPLRAEIITRFQQEPNPITSLLLYGKSSQYIASASLGYCLKTLDIEKEIQIDDIPIEKSRINVMKYLKVGKERLVVVSNQIGTILLFSCDKELKLLSTIYADLKECTVFDVCCFRHDGNLVVVVALDDLTDAHLLKFFIDESLYQEYAMPDTIRFCETVESLGNNGEHLIVGNSKGVLNAWSISQIFADQQQEVEPERTTSPKIEAHNLEDFIDFDEQLPSSIEPRKPVDPVRDSREGKEPGVSESLSAFPRTELPVMEQQPKGNVVEIPPTPNVRKPPEPTKESLDGIPPTPTIKKLPLPICGSIEMIPPTPTMKQTPPSPSAKQEIPKSSVINPSSIHYPPQPKPKKKVKFKKTEHVKDANFGNPAKFMNILEKNAIERDEESEELSHPFAKPQMYTANRIQEQIEQLKNAVFDPIEYMKEKKIHFLEVEQQKALDFDRNQRLYQEKLSSSKSVDPYMKRKVPKQISQAYLEYQKGPKPKISQYLFPKLMEPEVQISHKQEEWKRKPVRSQSKIHVGDLKFSYDLMKSSF